MVSPTKDASEQEAGKRRETHGRGRTLANHFTGVLTELLDALLVELGGGGLQRLRRAAGVVAILRAEPLVDRCCVVVDEPAQPGERLGGLGLAFVGELGRLGLGLDGPVVALGPRLGTVCPGAFAGFRAKQRGTGTGFLERAGAPRLRLVAPARRRGRLGGGYGCPAVLRGIRRGLARPGGLGRSLGHDVPFR